MIRCVPGWCGVLVWVLVTSAVRAATLPVPPGSPVQPVLDAAADGDVVQLAAGTYPGDLDFRGRAVTVRGVGPTTILAGTGAGPVVRFVAGEGPDSVLDAVTVTGGVALDGGGILVRDASPTILRSVVTDNRAVSRGSGIHLERSQARVANTLFLANGTAGLDPHTVQVTGGAPVIANNTIVRGDSNGILVGGGATATVRNNVIATNGARIDGEVRGRGICDFGTGTVIQYNLFHANRRAALLTGGTDYRRIRAAQRALDVSRLAGNLDGDPRFRAPRMGDYGLRAGSRALHAGDPDPAWANRDGTRNTMGHTGGPDAALD